MSDRRSGQYIVTVVLTIGFVIGTIASAGGVVAGVGQYEPNDDFDTATEITSGFSNETSVGPDDEDYFAIDVAEGETIDVVVRNSKDASISVNVDLYGPTGELLNSAEDLSTDISDQTDYRIGYEASQAGTYYIRVDGQGLSDDPATSYTLDVVTGQNDRFEPNGIAAKATTITPGTYTDLALLSGDTDYYAVTLDAGETINVTVQNDKDAAFDPDVTLSDGGGEFLASATELSTEIDDRTAYRIGYEVDTAGTYYLKVQGAEYDEHEVGYTMNVEVAANDRFEPNGNTDKATEITSGSFTNLSLLSGDTDYYAVKLGAGETINVTIQNNKNAPFDPSIELQDSGGDSLATAEDLSTQVADQTKYRIGYEADTTGTYYLKVQGAEYDEHEVGYTMNVEIASNDRFEPNGLLANATPIGPGTYNDLQILSEEHDYFAIRAAAGEPLTATVQHSADTNYDLEVLNANERVLASGTDISDSTTDTAKLRASYTPDTTQTYYIRVDGLIYNEETAPYTLVIHGGQKPQVEPPTADISYTPSSPAPGETISFDASASTAPDGTIDSYAWDFDGDGSTDATGVTAEHTYTAAGEYTVELTVTQADGSEATDDTTITVATQPAGLPEDPSFFEVIDIITAYNNDEPYNGVEVGFQDVIDAISAYNEGR